MDRRFSLALVLSLMFVMGWQLFFTEPPPPEEEGDATEVESPERGTDPSSAGGEAELRPETGESSTPTPPPEPESTATQAERDEQIWVDTDLYRARLSNRGATIVELYSREYDRRVWSEEEAEELDELERMQPYFLDMDPEARSLLFQPAKPREGSASLATSNWEHERREVEGGEDHVFRFDDGAGTKYTKLLRFREGLHHIGVQIVVETDRSGSASYELIAAGNATDRRPVTFTRAPSAVVVLGDDELNAFTGEELYDDGRETVAINERLLCFGSFTNHFAAVLTPEDETTANMAVNVYCDSVYDHELLERHAERDGLSAAEAERRSRDEAYHQHARSTLAMTVPLGERTELNFQLFAGPKMPALLEEHYPALTQLYVEDYGSFGWINRGLLWILRTFHSLTQNWGVAIILLTVLVKILLFPVMRIQSRSMEDFQKKMQKLKPKLDALKEKYKSNLRKFQEEQQKLMREHQVRPPVMGCLIIFLQFPVFIGLFQILKSSFELRHQPFFGWIADLSQPDALVPFSFTIDLWLTQISAFNLLPLLMIAAMVWQFKSMPKPKDEQAAQVQKMMMIMPFGFGIFLYNYASGLSLYMLTNALLGIVQTKFFRVNTG